MFSLKVKSDWSSNGGNGISLLPDLKPVTITLKPTYDGMGLCD